MLQNSVPIDRATGLHHSVAGGWEPGPSLYSPIKRNPLIDAELHLDAARELAHRSEMEADADLDLAWDYERRALLHTITALRRCLDAIDHGVTA